MAEGVVLHAADGAIVACNPAAERILGLTAGQMMGRTPRDPRWRAVREDGTPFPAEEHPAARTLRSGRPLRDVIMGVHRADGRLRWISVGTDTLPGGDEGGRMVLSTFMDVTERRTAEQALRADAAQHAALTRVATLVASGAAPGAVFATVAREAARVLDAEAAGVVRCDPEGTVRVVGTWSFADLLRPPLGSLVPLDAPTAVARALRERRPARVTGYEGLDGGDDVPYRCGAACPVQVEGRLWGAVTVAAAGRDGFDDAATTRLERFADLVALAVSGAEARERLVGLATTDDLTGLANLRAFRERLDQEVGRAVRHGRPLSLVAIDIDHFKAVNDAHGHPAGDRVLAAVARRLRDLARGEDLLARVGGEEFAWIIPETGAAEAGAAAERAVHAVRREGFPGVGRVTISAGVGELRAGSSPADLVGSADLALYAAKAGRDRVAQADGGAA
ncbi:sensor domain-containing diguanylate cyclase [Miltoncostaea oceani]|uniref:sensor domain-containing diguanylate cyclase n=1 Tax=Miltoncostaea oceani TaxID=2843216 RepID=UPI001C3CF722|nr:diguanylate cyclase [Miltoncostaea oceani]